MASLDRGAKFRPTLLTFFGRLRRSVAHAPLEAALALAALGTAIYVLVAPLAASRYVPMVDLPFHATSGATFAHYEDPSYHLKEQFELHPFSNPVMLLYAPLAALMRVLPVTTAMKIGVFMMLALVPAGLAVLFHGARKSPLLGLLGLGMCWGNLTHWGFLTYVAALGLFAMAVGFTLLVVDRPTRGRRIGLALTLVALFFSHIYRFPFGVAAVVGTAVVMYPATRRFRPILLPLVPALVLFAVWWKIRPPTLEGSVALGFHPERVLAEYGGAMTDGFNVDGVRRALMVHFDASWFVAVVAAAHAVVRRRRGLRRFGRWDIGVTVVPLACAAVFFVLFMVMPMWLGSWWYVYPREATATTIILCGACPDLPRAPRLRAALVAVMALAGIGVARQVAERYAEFAAPSEDFHRITQQIPRAPKLFYLIYDHSGTSRSTSPFLHLPAYVQAEKGGWLSWHFAVWGHSPVRFRPREEPGAVIPPKTPPRWEWTPQQYNIKMTPFFDWFLVRQKTAPDSLFAPDPTIVRVDHVGLWWLYRRKTSMGG